MKPIRLDDAIVGAEEALGHYECAEIESQSELAVLRRIESGEIVTPADEALAAIAPITTLSGTEIPPPYIPDPHVKMWVEARRKVAALEEK